MDMMDTAGPRVIPNAGSGRLDSMLGAQLALQRESMKAGDPRELEGDALADFVTWNVYALIDELVEAMGEFQWKPWVTDGSRGQMKGGRDAFVGELVDAFHFFMNLLLAASPGMEPAEIANDFISKYLVKRETNARRQAEGYSAEKDKDGRELDRPASPKTELETMQDHAARKAVELAERNARMRQR